MKKAFQNNTVRYKILVYAQDTWMRFVRGEGEKEIANQGWSVVKSFSQETEANDQALPMIGRNEPMLKTKSQVQDAHDTLTQLPFFFSQVVKRQRHYNEGF